MLTGLLVISSTLSLDRFWRFLERAIIADVSQQCTAAKSQQLNRFAIEIELLDTRCCGNGRRTEWRHLAIDNGDKCIQKCLQLPKEKFGSMKEEEIVVHLQIRDNKQSQSSGSQSSLIRLT